MSPDRNLRRWLSSRSIAAVASALLCALPAGRALAGDEPSPTKPSEPSAPASAATDDSEDPDPTPESLDKKAKDAVAKGVAWLRSRQHDDGSWGALAKGDENTYNGKGHAYTEPYGPTALALYTLMKCGVPNDDPQVRKGFVFLRKSKTEGECYEISMKILAATATADPFKQAKEASADKVRLSGEMKAWCSDLIARLAKLKAPNGWRYWGPKDENKGGPQDLSSTQLACLALFAAERCGVKTDPSLWTGIITYALAQQDTAGPERPRAVHPRPPKAQPKPAAPSAPEGTTAGPAPAAPGSDPNAKDAARGFSYIKDKGPSPAEAHSSGGMTGAGIGCLMMARFILMTKYPKTWATQDAAKIQQAVYDGLAWLDANWSPYENSGGWNYYYEYCVERAMDLIGSWKIGSHFWYTEMAEQIVGRQKEKGNWEGGNAKQMNGDVLDTCFALLFLRRATKGGIPFPSVTGGSDTPAADTR